jgi:hypothetical protein
MSPRSSTLGRARGRDVLWGVSTLYFIQSMFLVVFLVYDVAMYYICCGYLIFLEEKRLCWSKLSFINEIGIKDVV